MAVEAYELATTRGATNADGRFTATRRFAIWDDASPITTPAAVAANFGTTAGSTAIPDVGTLFPGEVDVYCVSYSVECDSLSRNTWTVTFNYDSGDFSSATPQPQQIGYTEFTYDYGAEFRDVYRSDPGLSIPQYGNAGTNTGCGGSTIAVGGEPLSILRYFTTLEITEVVSSQTMVDRAAKITLARGKRNLTSFYGSAIGRVLYKGARATRIGIQRFSITHSFLDDDWYHMIQVARKGSDGRVLLERTESLGLIAAYVYWRQPFPMFADFNLLSENF